MDLHIRDVQFTVVSSFVLHLMANVLSVLTLAVSHSVYCS